MSSPDKEESKITRKDIITIIIVTCVALAAGVLLLVWGPYNENRDLKRKLQVYSQPGQKPPPITPDTTTANSLKASFAPQSNPSLALRNAALKSKMQINSLDDKSSQVDISLTGTMQQIVGFDNNVASYFAFQKDGQARGLGPALAVLDYKVLPIATRRGYYQLDVTVKPARTRAPQQTPTP